VIESRNLEWRHGDGALFQFAARRIPVALEFGDLRRVDALDRAHRSIELREIDRRTEAEAQREEESPAAVGESAVGEHALHFGQNVTAEMPLADANLDIDLKRHIDGGANIEIIARELEAGQMRLDQLREGGLEFSSTARQAPQIRLIDGMDRDEHRVPAACPAETRLGRRDIGMAQRHLLPVAFGDGAELDGAERFRRDLAHMLDGLGLLAAKCGERLPNPRDRRDDDARIDEMNERAPAGIAEFAAADPIVRDDALGIERAAAILIVTEAHD